MRVLAALAKEVDPEGAAACVGGHFLSRRHSATFGYIRLHSARSPYRRSAVFHIRSAGAFRRYERQQAELRYERQQNSGRSTGPEEELLMENLAH